MKTLLVRFLSHSAASIICFAVFAFTPMALYGVAVIAGILYNGDPGGWLNFFIVPVFSVGLSLVTTFLILLPITLVLEWLSSRFRLSRWLPLLAVFPVSVVVLTAVIWLAFKPTDMRLTLALLIAWCFVGSICFALYWTILSIGELILNSLGRLVLRLTKGAVAQ